MALAVNTEQVTVEGLSSRKTSQEPLVTSQFHERPEEGIFILPGGYVDENGVSHWEVELSPVTGKEEEFLANVQPNARTASVVTGLLSRCIKRVGSLEAINPLFVRDLLVGDRDYLIMKLREMTFGQKVDAILRCPNSLCGKPMDVTLFLDDMQIERKTISNRFFTLQLSFAAVYRDSEGIEHQFVEFRLPTGADQEAVAPMVRMNEAKAMNQLLARCIRRIGELTDIDEAVIVALPDLARQEIEAKMEQLAPQVEIELDAVCPECQKPFVTPFDLTAFFFAEIKRNLRNLEREVHFLAWHYHWSEREILSLTRRKRLRYIELLQEEIERLNSS